MLIVWLLHIIQKKKEMSNVSKRYVDSETSIQTINTSVIFIYLLNMHRWKRD